MRRARRAGQLVKRDNKRLGHHAAPSTPRTRRPQSSDGTAPTYDHNGNTTADSGLTFVYNAWNQLVAAKNGCNLTVQGLHTFAVGNTQVLVHNTSGSATRFSSPRA